MKQIKILWLLAIGLLTLTVTIGFIICSVWDASYDLILIAILVELKLLLITSIIYIMIIPIFSNPECKYSIVVKKLFKSLKIVVRVIAPICVVITVSINILFIPLNNLINKQEVYVKNTLEEIGEKDIARYVPVIFNLPPSSSLIKLPIILGCDLIQSSKAISIGITGDKIQCEKELTNILGMYSEWKQDKNKLANKHYEVIESIVNSTNEVLRTTSEIERENGRTEVDKAISLMNEYVNILAWLFIILNIITTIGLLTFFNYTMRVVSYLVNYHYSRKQGCERLY